MVLKQYFYHVKIFQGSKKFIFDPLVEQHKKGVEQYFIMLNISGLGKFIFDPLVRQTAHNGVETIICRVQYFRARNIEFFMPCIYGPLVGQHTMVMNNIISCKIFQGLENLFLTLMALYQHWSKII